MRKAFRIFETMVCLILDKGKKNDDELSYKPNLFGKHIKLLFFSLVFVRNT